MLSSCSPRTKLCHESRARASCRLLPLFMTRWWTRKSNCCKSVTERERRRVSCHDCVVKGYGYVFALRDSGALNFECDLICALQVCTEGSELADIENIMSEIDNQARQRERLPTLVQRWQHARVSDVKFGGKRARVCDVVDKGCVFALAPGSRAWRDSERRSL